MTETSQKADWLSRLLTATMAGPLPLLIMLGALVGGVVALLVPALRMRAKEKEGEDAASAVEPVERSPLPSSPGLMGMASGTANLRRASRVVKSSSRLTPTWSLRFGRARCPASRKWKRC